MWSRLRLIWVACPRLSVFCEVSRSPHGLRHGQSEFKCVHASKRGRSQRSAPYVLNHEELDPLQRCCPVHIAAISVLRFVMEIHLDQDISASETRSMQQGFVSA